jgi:DNA-binding protein HU-beta
MSSKEFEDVLIENLGVTRDQAAAVWERVIESVQRALLAGRSVSLVHVATLAPYEKAATRYRDPASGKMVKVPPCPHIKLTLAANLKDALRDPRQTARHKAAWDAVWAEIEKEKQAAREAATGVTPVTKPEKKPLSRTTKSEKVKKAKRRS